MTPVNIENLYSIVATERSTGKRVRITGQMTEREAFNWQANAIDKKHYKYFRPAKYKNVKKYPGRI